MSSSSVLDGYFHSNYYSVCPKSNNFVSSPDFASYFLQFSAFINVPLFVFAGYCVLKKTPKSMYSMKWVYFNMHFWLCFSSLMLSSLMTPISWLPTASSSMMGLMSKLGISYIVQSYLAGTVGCLSMSSMISLFENRHNAVHQNKLRISNMWIRYSVVGINYLFSLVYPIPFLFSIPDEESTKLSALQVIPCPHEQFFEMPLFAVSIDPEFRIYAAISSIVCTCFMMFQLNFYSATCIYYLVFAKSRNSSRVTSDRQKKFFFGILIQISIPYGFLTPAFIYSFYSIFKNYYNQNLNNLFMIFLNFYGTVATFALLFSHTPYRDFLRKCLYLEKRKPIGKISISENRPSIFAL